MTRYDRVAIANVAWSELYEGDALVGDHDFIRRNGWGAERYNFVHDKGGRFHVYVRPVGPTDATPNPTAKDNWLLVLVSKRKGKSGLYIVGWFAGATFLSSYRDRPEYERAEGFLLTPDGTKFPYVVTATDGVRVPEDLRDVRIETTAMRRTSIMYLRGHGNSSESKEALAKSVIRQIGQLRATIELIGGDIEAPDDRGRSPISTDENRRREVEARSMEIATTYFDDRGYDVDDVSKNKREFCDLIAVKRQAPRKGERLFIEVKGTQADRPRFLMSRRERRFMEDPLNADSWRLLVVTSALSKPRCLELSVADTIRRFDLTTFTWFGEEKQ